MSLSRRDIIAVTCELQDPRNLITGSDTARIIEVSQFIALTVSLLGLSVCNGKRKPLILFSVNLIAGPK